LILALRLGNKGTATLRHDMKITVYRPTEPIWTVLETLHISPPIYPGETSDLIEIFLTPDRLGPEGLAIVVDDDDGIETVRECDESNNIVTLPGAWCP
jgi:hypothetical protein